MINLVSSESIINEFSRTTDPFLCRIVSQCAIYSDKYSFVDYWFQINNGDVTAVIGKYYGRITVYYNEQMNIDELCDFIKCIGYDSIICDFDLSQYFDDCHIISGEILQFDGNDKIVKDSCSDICVPTIKEYYKLLSACQNDSIDLPPYDIFLTDISHEIRHNSSKVYGIKIYNKLICGGCASFICENAITLSALATLAEYRKMGFGTLLIENIYRQNNCKTIYTYVLKENLDYYLHCGFELKCKFAECYSKR